MEFLKSPKYLSVIVLVTFFCLGFFTGWIGPWSSARSVKLLGEKNHEALENPAIHWLKSELDLSPKQIEKLRPVIRSGLLQMGELRREALNRINQCQAEMMEKVTLDLSPKQADKLREILHKKDADLQKPAKTRW